MRRSPKARVRGGGSHAEGHGSQTALVTLYLLAAFFWFLLFSPWTAGRINFWLTITLASGVLASSALLLDRSKLRHLYRFQPLHLAVGVVSATVWYLVFYAGDQAAARLFPWAPSQIANIYLAREQAPTLLVGLLLFFWIGPAEEIFWRGFVQQRLADSTGPLGGYLIASALYAAVHIWALNPVLLGAALLSGLFWGAIFLKSRSVWPGLISHAVWDLTIFVLLPLR